MTEPLLESVPPLSVVIPVRDDAAALARLLRELRGAVRPPEEILVVDGSSRDDSLAVAQRAGAVSIATAPGRGGQLAAGCAAARGRVLWLLHADTREVGPALAFLQQLAVQPRAHDFCWGRFDVAFASDSLGLGMVARTMNWRSRLTGICTGDQGMFLSRTALECAGGIPAQPLMEDIELSMRLKRSGRPLCPRVALTTSSRRWEQDGLWRTIFRMWRLRFRYWRGAAPEALARSYYR